MVQPFPLLYDPTGFFTRAQALADGLDDKALAAGIRRGDLHRFRRGYYTSRAHWAGLTEVGRHRLRTRAVVHSLGSKVAVSHVSAALEHGIASWGVALDRVHVTRLDGAAGRIEGDVVHHEGRCPQGELVEHEGLIMVDPTRAALETAITATSEAALVHLDSLLHLELESRAGLRERFESLHRWPGTQHLHIPVRMADGGAQSPGESRGRWLFRCGGLPAPVTQYAVYDAAGRLIGTCDWGWPEHGLLGEFDGKVKYSRGLWPNRSPEHVGDVVFAEKQREDALRQATGFGMVRMVWSDFGRPRVAVDRVRRALRSAA